MKAIVTRYHGPGNVRGSRISATAEGGNRITLPIDDALSMEENHRKAALALVAKKKWTFLPLISGGGLPNGDTVHMFSPELKEATAVLLYVRRAIGKAELATQGTGRRGLSEQLGEYIDSYFNGIGHKTTEGRK